MARALVGGPRAAAGSVSATVRVELGGVALLAQQLGPGQALVAELAGDQGVQVVRLAEDGRRVLCSAASPLAAFDPAIAVRLRLEVRDGQARLSINEQEVLACAAPGDDRGQWGVASLGAGARVVVDLVTVAR